LTFLIPGKKDLAEEINKKYDSKNNLTEEIKTSFNTVWSISKRKYNDRNQEIERIELLRDFDPAAEKAIPDNAVAIYEGKRMAKHYDTTIIAFSYDEKGNLINEKRMSPDRISSETISTFYANGQKSIGYGIYDTGDTTSVIIYQKIDGIIIKTRTEKGSSFLTETTWYNGNHIIKNIISDPRTQWWSMETFQYDEKGNEIEHIAYK